VANKIEQLGNSFACCSFYSVAQLGKGVAPPRTHGVGLLQICLSVRTVFFVGLKAAVPQPPQVANTADLRVKAVVPVLVVVDPIGSLGEGVLFHGLANLAGSGFKRLIAPYVVLGNEIIVIPACCVLKRVVNGGRKGRRPAQRGALCLTSRR